MSPEVARRVLELFREFRPPARPLSPDAARDGAAETDGRGPQLQDGCREWASRRNTVSFHMKHIYEKLQVHSKTEAVAKALRDHLI